MTQDIDRFLQWSKKIAETDLLGFGPPELPSPEQRLREAIYLGAAELPQIYQDNYVGKLNDNWDLILTQYRSRPFTIETLTGPVYQHGPTSEVRQELRRFLEVVSNVYYSFTSPEGRRAALGLPFDPIEPPLALFQHDGRQGPFTIPSAFTHIGIVSLPSTYRKDPVLWTAIAHETGGHDVILAIPNLLTDLQKGVQRLFHIDPEQINTSFSPGNDQIYGLMWSYWMSETAADVYGLLSVGPARILGFVAKQVASNYRTVYDSQPFPLLSTSSSAGNKTIDEHPIDILRIYLAMGVIESYRNLSEATRQKYLSLLEQIAQRCAQNAGVQTIDIKGFIPIDIESTFARHYSWQRQLVEMKANAQLVGKYIATEQFSTLGNHNIQDIETWDDADEESAQQVAEALLNGTATSNTVDEAQLLAGATLAVLADPEKYRVVNERLEEALDARHEQTPRWGTF